MLGHYSERICQTVNKPIQQLIGIGILTSVFAVLAACGGGGSQKSDPLVQEQAVAYVKRPVPTNTNGNPVSGTLLDQSDPTEVHYGAVLMIKPVATTGATETQITPALLGLSGRRWDVKDLEFSLDGSKLLFAAHLEPANNTDTQTWDIYEYNVTSGVLTRVMPALVATLGHEVSPSYLLDGRIIFSSTMSWTTRDVISGQGSSSISAVQTEGNNGGTVFNLHVMRVDGSELTQVSFGSSHDMYPSLIHSGPMSGRVVFSRWDTKANSGSNGMHLYVMDPDGRGVEYLYGRNSHNTGTTGDFIHFTKPRQMIDGRILSLVRRNTGTFDGGAVTAINVASSVDNNQSDVSGSFASTRNGITNTGRFNSVYPFYDGSSKAMVTYSDCFVTVQENGQPVAKRCSDPNLVNPVEAPPRYGVYVYDVSSNTRSVVTLPQEGFYYTDVAIAQPRPTPTFRPLSTDSSIAGILHMRNVIPAGSGINPATTNVSVRFYKYVYRSETDVFFAANNSRGMRELIGYAPVASDGSVRVRLPANVPLAMQLVYADTNQVIPGAQYDHEAWFSVRPGEDKTCNGCHVTGQPHGRRDLETLANSPGTTVAEVNRAGTGTNLNPVIDYLDLDLATVNILLKNNSSCSNQATWLGTCRSTTNYNAAIHGIWSASGCVGCHDPNLDANADGIPDGVAGVGNLDLTITGQDAGEPTNYNAYTNIVPSRITPGSASTSVFFTGGRFDTGGTHAGRLTAGQIKMIKEWTDLGAIYNNSPIPPPP